MKKCKRALADEVEKKTAMVSGAMVSDKIFRMSFRMTSFTLNGRRVAREMDFAPTGIRMVVITIFPLSSQ